MLTLLFTISIGLGTDPITMSVVILESVLCAILMRGFLPERWSIFACTPILFLCGLLAAIVSLKLGFIDVLDVHMGEDGDWSYDWPVAARMLPSIFVSATSGICIGALLVIAILHRIQRYV